MLPCTQYFLQQIYIKIKYSTRMYNCPSFTSSVIGLYCITHYGGMMECLICKLDLKLVPYMQV